MKGQIATSEVVAVSQFNSIDLTSRTLSNPDVIAASGANGLNNRDRLMLLLGANVGASATRETILEDQRRHAAERVFSLAAFVQLFAPKTTSVSRDATTNEKPKSMIDRLSSVGVLLPMILVLALGFASYRSSQVTVANSEAASWKSMADRSDREFADAKQRVKELEDKNDQLQTQIQTVLAQAAQDSKVDAKTLADSIGKVLAKSGIVKAPVQSVAAATPAVK
jgi:hypothetical protein